MKSINVLILFLTMNIRAAVADESPAQVVAGYAIACWEKVTLEASISLSMELDYGTSTTQQR